MRIGGVVYKKKLAALSEGASMRAYNPEQPSPHVHTMNHLSEIRRITIFERVPDAESPPKAAHLDKVK